MGKSGFLLLWVHLCAHRQIRSPESHPSLVFKPMVMRSLWSSQDYAGRYSAWFDRNSCLKTGSSLPLFTTASSGSHPQLPPLLISTPRYRGKRPPFSPVPDPSQVLRHAPMHPSHHHREKFKTLCLQHVKPAYYLNIQEWAIFPLLTP